MRNYWLKMVFLVAVSALLLAACGEKGGAPGASAGPAKGAPGVLASVGGKDITVDDLKTEAASLSPYAVSALADRDVREKILDNLVTKRLILQDADSEGMAKDPEVVKKLDEMKNTLLIELYIKRNVVDRVNVSDQAVQDYFNKNKQDLGSVRLSHILVKSEADAAGVLAKAKSGEDFAGLAKRYSLDPNTKNKGGDLGEVRWAQFGSPSLRDAAFKLKKGEISGIVKSQFGYHILKVTDKKPAADSDFAAMKEQLTKQVGDQMKRELFESIVKGLKAKTPVTVYKEALESANFGPGAAGPVQPNAAGPAGKTPSK